MTTLVAAWVIPGAGHFLQGESRKGAVFFVVLSGMFLTGALLSGRLFPFQVSDLLITLATLSQWALVLPHVVATLAGVGPGEITASAFEYGNTFFIVAGLLNMLVMLDARDLALGRKA
jgi:hypothetical protein